MEYKLAARALITNQQRDAITWIINIQTKYLFCGEPNQLAETVLMKNNIHARNALIYPAEVPIVIYGEESLTTVGYK